LFGGYSASDDIGLGTGFDRVPADIQFCPSHLGAEGIGVAGSGARIRRCRSPRYVNRGVLVGFFLEDIVESQLRSPLVIAGATAAFGVLLWLADLRRKNIADEHAVTLPIALLIGLAQVLALVPGTSRSGITITAGLFLGLSRQAACRFSFLLAMPAIGGAAVLEFYDLLNSPEAVAWDVLAVGLLIAAVSAYLCIKLFLQAVEKIGMLPFMLYRLVLAAILFLLFI
jgi:undecaprenyl-diphosphatase